jgi:epoxyqueuosine reductase
MRHVPPPPTLAELAELARPFGVDYLGVAPASVLERARDALHARRAAGLDGGMGFTYRDPERATDPTRIVEGARSLLVAARSYLVDEDDPRVARPAGAQARVARYAWTDHYALLRAALRAISRRLKASGERATMQCDENGLVDREAAWLAGLGWFGKNANLMVPGAGSWFVLGSVVTTAWYEPSAAPVRDGCGSCRRCLDRCPTGAIVAPGVIDANRCLAWVLQRPAAIPTELRAAVGDRIYGCDDCQEACPPSVRLGPRRRRPHDEAAGALTPWVDVLDLLEADDAAILARHGRWYIAERDPRWLRRNALVVLGNTGDGSDERTRRVLARYRACADEMLVEHANWASEQLGLAVSAGPRSGR